MVRPFETLGMGNENQIRKILRKIENQEPSEKDGLSK